METYNQCLTIIQDKKTLNNLELKKKWINFKNRYPKLYEMLTINDTLDLKMLKFLCENADKHKNMTQDQQLDLEVDIGKKLADKYIYSSTNINRPTQQQENFIKETLRNKLNNGNNGNNNGNNISNGNNESDGNNISNGNNESNKRNFDQIQN